MEKESRKRKIMDKGSDQIALITRRVQEKNHDQDHHNLHPPQQDNLNRGEDQASGISSKHSNVDKVSDQNEFGYGSRGPENQVLAEAAQAFAATFKSEIQSALDTTEFVFEASDDASSPSVKYANSFSYFTPKRINSCILSSENMRVVCSMMIALLVVFSNINLPRNIIKSKSIISSRPLYVLLLTDVSIVVGRLILWKRRGKNKFKKGEGSILQEPDNWDGAVKLLELGLVFYQTIRAIFIDCSFYMVIVICGLSLL